MHMPVVSSLLAASAAARISGNVTQGAIFLPDAQPANAEKLDPQLVGFSIELDRWPDWAGRQVGRPNQFVHSVMRQLTDRSGAPPYFRIGGESPEQRHLEGSLTPQAPFKINLSWTSISRSAMQLIQRPPRPIRPRLQYATTLDETFTSLAGTCPRDRHSTGASTAEALTTPSRLSNSNSSLTVFTAVARPACKIPSTSRRSSWATNPTPGVN